MTMFLSFGNIVFLCKAFKKYIGVIVLHKLSFKEQIFTGITLFSMFFGAGNLIFPPILGAQGGEAALMAFIGFIISAVGFPILGVIAIVVIVVFILLNAILGAIMGASLAASYDSYY